MWSEEGGGAHQASSAAKRGLFELIGRCRPSLAGAPVFMFSGQGRRSRAWVAIFSL